MLLAAFLSPSLGGAGYAEGMTSAGQLGAQAAGVAAVALWSAAATAVTALAVARIVPMPVGEEAEREGPDLSSHGERAWAFD